MKPLYLLLSSFLLIYSCNNSEEGRPAPSPIPDTVKPKHKLIKYEPIRIHGDTIKGGYVFMDTRLFDSLSSVTWPIPKYIESDSLPVIVHFKGDTLNYIIHRDGRLEIHNLNLDKDTMWWGSRKPYIIFPERRIINHVQ